MLTLTLNPRFAETDQLGHINNSTLAVWFEEARTPVFRLFNPDLSHSTWNLILARLEIDFIAQLYYGQPVTIETGIVKIGNSSLTLQHLAYQQGQPACRGQSVLVHFDYQQQKPTTIPENIRKKLTEHLIDG